MMALIFFIYLGFIIAYLRMAYLLYNEDFFRKSYHTYEGVPAESWVKLAADLKFQFYLMFGLYKRRADDPPFITSLLKRARLIVIVEYSLVLWVFTIPVLEHYGF